MAIETQQMTLLEIEDLARRALIAAGTSAQNAEPLAKATAATEADGVASHGLAYIPIYCQHVECGKVDGKATPILTRPRSSVVAVDAATGFAHSAIDMGTEALVQAAKENGVAALVIKNSYNCGVLGYHTARFASMGVVSIGFTNAPASIAPSGGARPVVGTNPFSIAVPAENGAAQIVIDQSASTIAKSEVMKHAAEGAEIPLGWALDAEGNPTTDPNAGLKGSMAPAGGYKGVGIALVTEIMAAALTGATLGIDASPFSGTAGGPPKTGQFFLAIDPEATSGGVFSERITALIGAIHDQDGAHLPVDGRRAKRQEAQEKGVAVNVATLAKINAFLSA
ncbi:MAG: Ldh family oxidoreductase [Paracoccaceae bacterium]